MNIDKFLEKINLCNSAKPSKFAPGGVTWEQWTAFADVTRKINFNCGFDNDEKKCLTGRISGCCGDCSGSMGYLKILPKDRNVIKRIAGLFNEKTGFLALGKGCKLPRKYRSLTCLTFSCDTAGKKTLEKDLINFNYSSDRRFIHQWSIVRYIRSLSVHNSTRHDEKIRHAILSLIA